MNAVNIEMDVDYKTMCMTTIKFFQTRNEMSNITREKPETHYSGPEGALVKLFASFFSLLLVVF